jgi:hypothetical protein
MSKPSPYGDPRLWGTPGLTQLLPQVQPLSPPRYVPVTVINIDEISDMPEEKPSTQKLNEALEHESKAKAFDAIVQIVNDIGFDTSNLTYSDTTTLIQNLCSNDMESYATSLAVVMTSKIHEAQEKIDALNTALLGMQEFFTSIPNVVGTTLKNQTEIDGIRQRLISLEQEHKANVGNVLAQDLAARLHSIGSCTYTTKADMNTQVQSKLQGNVMLGLRRFVEAYGAS